MSPPAPTPRAAGPRPPAGLTLLVGGEEFLVARAVARVMAAARAVDPAAERREVDLAEPAGLGALQSALSPSLFAEAAVVVVREVAEASEDAVVGLLAGVADLPEETWVVVVHPGSKAKKVLDRLRAQAVRDGIAEVACTEVKKGRPTRELLQAEARAAGRRLTDDGADALALALGSDIGLLVGALEQLLADVPEDPIDAAVVTATFSGVAEISGFQLADAVWEGRARLALQRLRWGLTSQTVTGPGAVGSLAAGLRALVRVSGTPRGLPDADVARAAGVPPFKVRSIRQAAQSWEAGRLADAVIALAALDAQVKGGLRPGESLEPAQKEHAIESFVAATAGWGQRPGRAPRRGVPGA